MAVRPATCFLAVVWTAVLIWAAVAGVDAIDLAGSRGGRKGGIQIGGTSSNRNPITDGGHLLPSSRPGVNDLNPNRPNVTYVMIVPSTRFESVRRKYRSSINEALSQIKNGKVPGNHLNKHYSLQVCTSNYI